MTAKDYLQQYRNADREINAKLDQISRLRELATKTTQTLTPNRSQTTQGNKVESIVAKIVDMEREVDEDIDRLGAIKKQVQVKIAKVPNAKQRAVLTRRYINGETWSQICTSVFGKREDFSDRYDSYLRRIYRYHKEALRAVEMSLNVTTGK